MSITELVNHYGYIFLFCALSLEVIAFPLPGDFIMAYCGFLIYQGKMDWLLSIFSASSGAMLGINISYFLGIKLGEGFLKKYGSYIHLGSDKLDKTSKWFETYGNNLLIAAYFIPGVRHIIGYFCGITHLSYKKFLIYAYTGALIWTSTFISAGKLLGSNWSEFHRYLSKYLFTDIIIIVLIFLFVYIYKKHKVLIFKFINKNSYDVQLTFKYISKKKLLLAIITVFLLGFFVLLIGFVGGYLENEITVLNTII